ncbi:cysteine methyltransferase, partial [Geobacillus sp. MMMUD3]|nr:cysteine methyltransferase [Geobacillus sp. MMMUD3]
MRFSAPNTDVLHFTSIDSPVGEILL